MRLALLVILVLVLPSCFLFRDHKRRSFSYTDAKGEASTVATIVPKGYKREELVKDSLGHQGVLYHYKDGAQFYIFHYPDTGSYQLIDTTYHIPKPHLQGGIFYKGIDSTKRWWREAQPPFFRIGYRYVNNENEIRFDSAVNYMKPGVSIHQRK